MPTWGRVVAGLGAIGLGACLLSLGVGCGYPVRSTPLWPVRGEARSTLDRPEHVYALTVVEAELPPLKRGGLPWDEDGSGPDPYVRIFRDGELLWESPVRKDTRTPRWNHTFERAVRLSPGTRLRVELWDEDFPRSDPAGVWEQTGLPAALQGGQQVRLSLEGGARLLLRLATPRPMIGTGIPRYEVRPDALVVLEVIPESPAGRAGVRPGDRIVAIDGQPVSRLGEGRAVGLLSRAGRRRGTRLGLQDEQGRKREVTLDGGFVWLTM